MKNRRLLLTALSFLLYALSSTLSAQNAQDSYYVYYTVGTVKAYPKYLIQRAPEVVDDRWQLTLTTDSIVDLGAVNEVREIAEEAPVVTFPKFTSYKFNNKFNRQLHADVEADVTDSTCLEMTTSVIGKDLIASFQVDNPAAIVTIGNEVQQSKKTLNRFSTDKTYILSLPGYQRLAYYATKPAEWQVTYSGGEGAVTTETREEVKLTAEQLSTNHPTNFEDYLSNCLDDDPSTYFHSTWGTGIYTNDVTEPTFIDINAGEALSQISIFYKLRSNSSSYFDYTIDSYTIYASNDSVNWVKITTVSDGLPATVGGEYTSPAINLGGRFPYIRFEATTCGHKNYMVLSQFKLYNVTTTTEGGTPVQVDSVLISPAEYALEMIPMGREVTVRVNFLTDRAQNVPRVDLTIDNGAYVCSKSTYLNATIKITGNGVYDDFESRVRVRGRGNSSWSTPSYTTKYVYDEATQQYISVRVLAGSIKKNPYRLKFESAVKPFGLTKGKNWVMQANKISGSMLCNALSMKMAQMVGTEACNHVVPLDLYVNGTYHGSYIWTENIGLSNNSVDLADDSNAAIYEFDSYGHEFLTDDFSLPVTLKDPNAEDVPADMYADMQKCVNDFVHVVADESKEVDKVMDVDAFARFFLVNDLSLNKELNWPKSTFLYREDIYDEEGLFKFGPVWDFDWAYGYEGSNSFFSRNATSSFYPSSGSGQYGEPGHLFFQAVRQRESVKRAYYQLWKEFMELHLDELMDFADDYYAFAKPSFESNATVWGDGTRYATIKDNAKAWLLTRANDIFSKLDAYEPEPEPEVDLLGDVNQDGVIDVADLFVLSCAVKKVEGYEPSVARCDMNQDGYMNGLDIPLLLDETMKDQSSRVRTTTLTKNCYFSASANPIDVGMTSEWPVVVKTTSKLSYISALQFDVTLPEGMRLEGIGRGDYLNSKHRISYRYMDDTHVRVMIYGESNEAMAATGTNMITLKLHLDEALPTTACKVVYNNLIVTFSSGEEVIGTNKTLSFVPTAIETEGANTFSVRGGRVLTIEALHDQDVDIYTLDGRLVRSIAIQQGVNTVELPRGIYVVCGKKIVIG